MHTELQAAITFPVPCHSTASSTMDSGTNVKWHATSINERLSASSPIQGAFDSSSKRVSRSSHADWLFLLPSVRSLATHHTFQAFLFPYLNTHLNSPTSY